MILFFSDEYTLKHQNNDDFTQKKKSIKNKTKKNTILIQIYTNCYL